jgi:phospholipase C
LQNFLTAVTNGCPNNCTDSTVPNVSWIVPAIAVSEHDTNPNEFAGSPYNIANTNLKAGESYVTMLIQQIMKNTALWNSSIIFVAWDDWGGYYDHVRPPKDSSGQLMYGIRVPGIAISPWVNNGGTLDHQTLSFDAYLKLVEDLFMQGTRLGGDGRTSVRENEAQLGDLLDEFDFRRTPLAPPGTVTGLSCQAQ